METALTLRYASLHLVERAKRMKIVTDHRTLWILLFAFTLSCTACSVRESPDASSLTEPSKQKPSIVFDGDRYELAFVDARGEATINEYLREGETIHDWDQMVSVSESRGFFDFTEFMRAYVQSIQDNLAMQPEVYQKGSNAMLVISFLTAPDRSHVEFTIFRAVRVPGIGIRSYGFSKRVPFSENVDVTEIMAHRDRWIEQISRMDQAVIRSDDD